MDSNSVSLIPELAPIAEFDKSPPSPPVGVHLKRLRPGVSPLECTSESQLNSPPNEKEPMDDLLPPPETISWSDVKKVKVQRSRSYESNDEYGHIIITLAIILLIGVSALTIFWAFYYQQGSAWANAVPEKQFNPLHPTLMVNGFITLRGFSVLLYGICRYFRPIYVKQLRTICHTLAFFCIVIGFLAVLDFHDQTVIKNSNSLHSWYGLIALGLFGMQYFFGLLLLLICNKGRAGLFVPIHTALDIITFSVGVAACITGLTEKGLTSGSVWEGGLPDEAIIMTVIGAIIVEILAVIIYIL